MAGGCFELAEIRLTAGRRALGGVCPASLDHGRSELVLRHLFPRQQLRQDFRSLPQLIKIDKEIEGEQELK